MGRRSGAITYYKLSEFIYTCPSQLPLSMMGNSGKMTVVGRQNATGVQALRLKIMVSMVNSAFVIEQLGRAARRGKASKYLQSSYSEPSEVLRKVTLKLLSSVSY